MAQLDLWGVVVESNSLRSKFIEPPFSILDARSDRWQKRKKKWRALGIQSEIGRDAKCLAQGLNKFDPRESYTGTSIFDSALCELIYNWFVPKNGKILDPFCGGSVRGIVAHYLGYKYTGIDIRQEQIDSNYMQAREILEQDNQPIWLAGDSNKVLDSINEEFDFVFSCPPYGDLEVYSDLEGDISNMSYNEFLEVYRSIIYKSCKLLKKDCLACFVVGEFRDKKGNYVGFVPDTIKAFTDCGLSYYNEAIIATPIGSAMLRAENCMKTKKLVKTHQNILVFKK